MPSGTGWSGERLPQQQSLLERGKFRVENGNIDRGGQKVLKGQKLFSGAIFSHQWGSSPYEAGETLLDTDGPLKMHKERGTYGYWFKMFFVLYDLYSPELYMIK